MASPTRSALRGRIAAVALSLAALSLAPPAFALRVIDYNILNYPGSSGPARAPYYRTILSPLDADVIVTEEMASTGAPTEFLNEVLNVMEPGQWATVPFIDGNDTDASMFYRTSTVQFLGQWAFYPNPANQLRYVHVYRLKPLGYASDAAEFRLYTAHLKASTGYESQRLAECQGLRDSMNAMPPGTRAMICGDMNFYTQAAEPGYAKLLESESNNTGRCYDMLPAGSWHDNLAFAPYHTQSPCKDGTCASGAATGGMDDRFDMVLPTVSMVTGQGLSAITGTMKSVGNDGKHLNLNITDAPTISEGADYASALKLASDHLPVLVDLQVPARVGKSALLAFPTVIVGAPAQMADLTVSNPAAVPGDTLDCTFVATSGFGAPGPLAVAADSSAPATITMNTSAPLSGGLLTINSNAPDSLVSTTNLMGTVLDHAQASLDSLSALLADTLDFGEQPSGSFDPLLASVHNLGWDALRARLAVSAAEITGGGGHFSIHSFNPRLVSGAAARWSVLFDSDGATTDSTYVATLTFHSGDEPLPGAAAQPDLHYTLLARVRAAGAVAPPLPAVTRLYRPVPNPMFSAATLRFDLARASRARLEVFDAGGRRVATVADREFAAGSYSFRWSGRGDSGAAAGSGLYFVRLTGPGLAPQTVRLAVVR